MEMSKPKRIYFEITDDCNLRCKYCFVNKAISEKALTKEKIIGILEGFDYKPIITFSGSEPMMYPGFLDLVSCLKGKGFFVDFFTNATLIDDKAAELIVKSGVDEIRVSVDGPKEINDAIRGKGVYDKIINSVQLINKHKRENNSALPYVIFSPVITSKNISYIDELIRIAKENSADEVNYLTLVWLDEKVAKQHISNLKKRLNYAHDYVHGLVVGMHDMDLEKYEKKINNVKKLACELGIRVTFWQSSDDRKIFSEWYSPKIGQKNITKCGFINDTLRIDQNGNVISCPIIRYKYGSVLDSDIITIWNNDNANKFRKEINEGGLFPACYKCHRVLV